VVWGTNQFITAATDLPAWATENFAVLFVAPPTSVTAVAGDQSAYVTWTPTSNPPITTFTINAYVGASIVKSIDVTSSASTKFYGLTNGVTYTFTVMANAIGDSSPESPHSNAVTPTRAAGQVSPIPAPTRTPANQSSPVPPPSGR
jgi:hypothetical protein